MVLQVYEPAGRSGPQFEEWLERQQYREPVLRSQRRAGDAEAAMPQYFDESRSPGPYRTTQPASPAEWRSGADQNQDRRSEDNRQPETVRPSSAARSRSDIPREAAATEQRIQTANGRSRAQADQQFEDQKGNLGLARGNEKFESRYTAFGEAAAEDPLGPSDRDALWHEPDEASLKAATSSENDSASKSV